MGSTVMLVTRAANTLVLKVQKGDDADGVFAEVCLHVLQLYCAA